MLNTELRVETLLRHAESKTSLSDWGGTQFREPLSLLLQDMQSLPLTEFGRFAARETFIQALTNRLECVDAASRLTTIEREPEALRRPIFVLGLHRSGTTWLQELLAEDRGTRSFRFFELVRPAQPDRRRARMALFASGRLSPEMKFVHPIEVDSPEECWALFMNTFAVVNYALHFDVPNYARWLLRSDLSYAYSEYKTQLALLLRGNTSERVVLKCPEHLWCLESLIRVFPEACIVWLHRDPLKSVASYSSLSALNRRALSGTVDLEGVGPDITRKFAAGISKAMSVRANIAASRFCDVAYVDLVRDPVGTVERIYRHFDFNLQPEARARVQARVAETQAPAHRYSASQYGVVESEVRAMFAEYVRSYNVALE